MRDTVRQLIRLGWPRAQARLLVEFVVGHPLANSYTIGQSHMIIRQITKITVRLPRACRRIHRGPVGIPRPRLPAARRGELHIQHKDRLNDDIQGVHS